MNDEADANGDEEPRGDDARAAHRVPPIHDLDPRDRDVFRAKALRARMAARCEEET
jgi:hypothetical protein